MEDIKTKSYQLLGVKTEKILQSQRRWQVSQHMITIVQDIVLVVHVGANLRNISVWLLQNIRKRFEKV